MATVRLEVYNKPDMLFNSSRVFSVKNLLPFPMLVYEDISDVRTYYLLKGTYLGVLQVLNESTDYNSSIKLNVTHTDGTTTVFELTVIVADLIKAVSDNSGSLVYYSDHEYKVTQSLEEILYRINDRSGSGGGTPGDSAYLYIAYASDASGTDFTLTFNANLDYIAILSTDTEIPTPTVTDFIGLWKNYKGAPGADGADGSNGIDGDDGANAYLYIAYASDDIGTDFSLSPGESLTYIAALSTDTEIITPQASDFAGLWRKYVGEDGTPADLTHYCYIAWRDAPGDGFTLTPNITAAYEAILITHTELTSPVEADFDGFWKPRFVPSQVQEVPAGGTTGQVLTKDSEDDFDTSWQTPAGGGSTQLTAIPSTDKTASGITTQFTANEAQAFGDVVKINGSGKVQLAKADVIANATALAMCVSESVVADATGSYLLIGFVRNDAWNWTIGEWIYLSLTGTTGNTLTQENPADNAGVVENNVIQMVGVANSANSFYFNPQLVQVEWKPSQI